MTSHGDASAPTPSPHVSPPPGNTPTGPGGAFQLSFVGSVILLTPRAFVPPGVAGQDIPEAVQFRLAAVGTAPGWAALSFCSPTGFIKVLRGQEVRIRLPPARTTVVPLPVTSQARPRRGSTPVWSPD